MYSYQMAINWIFLFLSFRNENQRFKRIVEKLERSPVCQRLPFRSFLVLPFQRITRIKLLVQVCVCVVVVVMLAHALLYCVCCCVGLGIALLLDLALFICLSV